jgi:hypothetical protein
MLRIQARLRDTETRTYHQKAAPSAEISPQVLATGEPQLQLLYADRKRRKRSSGKLRRRESSVKRPAWRQRKLLERRLSGRECGRKRRNGSGEKGTDRSRIWKITMHLYDKMNACRLLVKSSCR